MNNDDKENDLYSSYQDVDNNLYSTYEENNQTKEEMKYEVIKEQPRKSIISKILLFMFYIVVIGIGYVVYGMYMDNKYEFYIEKEKVVLANNSSYQIELKPKDERVFDYKNYKYESENEEIAEVDETGKITGVGIGETEIKIKTKNGYQEKKITVTIEELGNEEIKSSYANGQIETVVNGREEISIDAEYEVIDGDIEVDEYGHVESEDGSGGRVIVYTPNGEREEIEIPDEEEEIEVESIELIENNITLKKGTNGKINAKVLPENANNKTLTYESDNGNVKVDNNGNITGVSVGVSVITVTSSNGNTAYCVVSVTEEKSTTKEVKISSISIVPSTVVLELGHTQTTTLAVKYTPSNATNKSIKSWKSSNTKVVTVDSKGKITAKSAGTATITATSSNGKTGTTKVTVKPNSSLPTKISLNYKGTQELNEGKTLTLKATLSPTTAKDKLIWTSSNTGVATVSNGKVTAKKAGTTVITATTSNNLKATVTIKVNEVKITKISLDIPKSAIVINVGGSVKLNATLSPTGATSNLSWTSSNTGVATVSNGEVTAKSVGTATITVKTSNGITANSKIIVLQQENETAKNYRNALMENVEAFYRKGVNLQYDSYRRTEYLYPENISEQNIGYTACSGLVYQSYYQTFNSINILHETGVKTGIKLEEIGNQTYDGWKEHVSDLNNSKELKIKQHLLYYDENVYNKNKSNYNNYLEKFTERMLPIVKPGDIVLLEYGSNKVNGGHIVMIKDIDVNKRKINVIHSTHYDTNNYISGRYDINAHEDKYEEQGTVWYNFNDKSGNSLSLVERLKNIHIATISIIRVIGNDGKYLDYSDLKEKDLKLTSSAETRLKYPKIEINKVGKVDKSDNKIVDLGGTIQYTITIKNNSSKKYQNLIVKENKTDYVNFETKNGGTVNGNTITWNNISIEPGKTKTITYTVNVKNNSSNLGKYIISTGTVGDGKTYITNAKVIHKIGKNLSSTYQNKIVKTFKNTTKSDWNFVVSIYKEQVGNTKINNVLGNLNGKTAKDLVQMNCTNNSYIINEDAKKILLYNYYGVQLVSSGCSKNSLSYFKAWDGYIKDGNEHLDRARTITQGNLQTGDIIVYSLINNNKTINKVLLYVDNKLIGVNSNGSFTEVTGVDKFLRNMIGYTFVVLRPSLVM